MSRLTDLIAQAREKDSALGEELEKEFKALRNRRAFGLNFERHTPEVVELAGRKVRRGEKVRISPAPQASKQASKQKLDQRLWQVARIRREQNGRIADLIYRPAPDAEPERTSYPCDDLVVVAEFRDPIYPGLISTGRVKRSGDKPFHSVINAENYHALQALLYTHEGKIDTIYIDPPYNTRDKDWKYNNDYVDSDDQYKHSKWLAMMERRLKLAKRLLEPEIGVLIVTIDENEGCRLGLMLEQIFPEYEISPIHIVHNPRGVQGDNFSFVHETAFFVIPKGRKLIAPRTLSPEEVETGTSNLRNWGGESERHDAANCFYPIYVKDRAIVGYGDDVTKDDSIHPMHNEEGPNGSIAVWPIDSKGIERKWRYARTTVVSIQHLLVVKNLTRGNLKGDIEIQIAKVESKQKTIWQANRYDASTHGTQLIGGILGREFPFPKSLYATEECLDIVLRHRPNATILDFFSGSGTTCHAVMRLNKQDGGRRQCISVTNNEVSADEQKALRKKGLRQGDEEWEALGICEYITKPRLKAAITGKTPEGEAIKGDYKFTDEFPVADGFEENVEFFKLSYEAPLPVAHNRSFPAIAPLLWLKAGAQGRRIDKVTSDFAIADTYAVLFDLDHTSGFLSELDGHEGVRMAFIVTDDDRGFQSVCGELPARIEAVRLYESYLTNFTINTGRD